MMTRLSLVLDLILQIYHDGSNSFVTNSFGDLAIQTSTGRISLAKSPFEFMVEANIDADVSLYYDSAKKLATTATGIDVTGVITTDGMTTSADINFGDNDKAVFGAGSDLQIYHNGSSSIIEDVGTGPLRIRGSSISIENSAGTETLSNSAQDGAVTIYYNGSPKLATTATGIDVTGTAVTDGLTVAGNVSVDGGTIKLDGNYPVGTANVALGDGALDDGSLTGGYNTAIGQNSLGSNTTANNNTALGFSSLAANSTGGTNTAVGGQSLLANTTASSNTALGYSTMAVNTTGASNTAVGAFALSFNTTASYNTAVGYQAGYSNTTGTFNNSFGEGAL
jgi:hypothetical protein